MALNQMYAVSGRKVDPNYTAIINSQTPYLLSMKRQEAEDDLAKRSLALREQEMLQNEELAREQMEQNKKQTRMANLIGGANLGLRAGLGAYENIPDVKNVVDNAVGGVKGLITGPVSGVTPTWDTLSKAGDWPEYASGAVDWLKDVGTWGGGIIENAPWDLAEPATKLGEIATDIGSSFAETGGDVYTSVIDYLFGGM